MQLREYQLEAIDKIRACFRGGIRNVLLQASCGAGKTIIAAEIASATIAKGNHVLFLVNRRDLVKQTVEKFEAYGLGDEVGVIMAGEDSNLGRPIQVASLQTYGRRLQFDSPEINKWFHGAEVVVYDESHSITAKSYKAIVDMYLGKSHIVGLSATPCRADGTGLNTVFEEIVTCIPTQELIGMGFLVPATYYAPSKPDLNKIRTIAGDYDQKELGKRVNQPKLVGDIYENWARLASDRQTLVFATNVKHSKYIRDYFDGKGVSIEHIDAHTNDDERADIYRRFESGDLQVLTNVGVCTEGSDFPNVSAIVMAKPTRSLARWIQAASRGGRPYHGKKDFLLLDHCGGTEMHGFLEDPVEWTLSGKEPAAKKKIDRKKEKTILTCEMCSAAFCGPVCPACGHRVKDYGKKIEAVEADLVAVKKSEKTVFTMEEKRRWWAMFEYERRRLGKSESWLKAQYKSKFGVWYKGMDNVAPIEPDRAVKNWLTYQRVRYIKSKQKRENQLQEGFVNA